MSYLRSTSTIEVSSILVACAMFMFAGSTQAQLPVLARFDFNGESGSPTNSGPTQTGWSGFDSHSLGNNHHFGPPGSIAINVGSVGLMSYRDRIPEFSGLSNLESSPVVDVTRDLLISGNATLEVRVRFLEPNTEYDFRWHHYEPAHDDNGNQIAVYQDNPTIPANLLFETELFGASTTNFWTDFRATSNGSGAVNLFNGDHSSGSAANGYFNGFEVVGLSCVTPPCLEEFTWDLPGLGNWNDNSSWDPSTGFPFDADDTATFGNAIQNNSTVVVDSPVTVNRINFDHTQSYAIAGVGSVDLTANTEDPSVPPAIDVQSGSHQFQAIVNLLDSTTVDVASGSTLEFNNRLFLNGHTLTKTGEGTLAISNDVVLAGGSIDLQQGTVAGSGTVGGHLNNTAGTVAPGNSPGILTIDGDYTQDGSGTLALEIGGLVPGEEHDKLVVTGTATLGGTLDVSLINGFALSGDMEFDVLDFNSVVNDFSTFFLPTGLVWDVSDGTLCFGNCVGGSLTDYDNDGTWALGDLNLVLFNWNEDGAGLPPAWINSRPAGGTLVGLPELNQVLFNWGQPGSLAIVPEPATWMLGCLGLLFGLRFRRRRRAG